MRPQVIAKLFFCLVLLLSLCGCSFGASVDTLLAPPQLQGEQEQIYRALQNAVGNHITLQYPRTGDYLSSVVIADFDNDMEMEAVVFYRNDSALSTENALRINLLNREEGAWASVCDLPAEGAEIERVQVCSLGEAEQARLIVGYSVVDQSERALAVYRLQENTLKKGLVTPYTSFLADDFDGNCQNELLILYNTDSRLRTEATIYVPDIREHYKKYTMDLQSRMTECSQILCSHVSGGKNVIFLDTVVGATTMQTELLCFDGTSISYYPYSDTASTSTVRSVGLLTMDIDQDGIPEIPMQGVFPGYEKDSTDSIPLTYWMAVSNQNGLYEKYRGYYSVADGYAFLLPDMWKHTVTAWKDAMNGDLVFGTYAEDEPKQELLRIGITDTTEQRNSRLEEGYQLLNSRGKAYYLMKVGRSKTELARNAGDLVGYFRFVQSAV